jgi:DNA-binding NarL/FixJ family response regulator
MINIAVIEDNDTIREGLRILINETAGFFCEAAYPNCEIFFNEIGTLNAQVLLIDTASCGANGIDAVRKIKMIVPELVILILTLYEENDLIFDALCAGASGYIVKRTPPEKFLLSIKEAYNGGIPMNSEIARKVNQFFQKQNQINLCGDENKLSACEQNILNKLTEGNSFKAISDSLLMSIEEIRFSFKNIYKKLHLQAQMK